MNHASQLRSRVRERLVLSGEPVDRASVARALRAEGQIMDERALAELVARLASEMVGAGPLEGLLAEPGVTDILVNGPSDIWVDRGAGLVRVGVSLPDEAAVRQLAVRLAARAGRRLDDACPYVDARLPSGERLHAVIPPISTRGTAISLRVPSRRTFQLADLVASGTADDAAGRWLSALVAARAAFLVSGGTGSGKTTVLGALLNLVAANERLVIVEDTTELRPGHPHVVHLESRPPNVEGQGAVTLQSLVRQALRMRPDRLVVGEVRGAEVVELLAALNTGHEGGCGTLHANRAADVPARLEALALAAGLAAAGARAQMLAGIDVLLHVRRESSGARVLDEIAVMVAGPDRDPQVRPALTRSGGGYVAGPGLPRLRERVGPWLR